MTDAREEPNDKELMKLLPFYVNNTLEQQEQADVDDYLGRSETARRDLIFLKRLRKAVKTQPQTNSPGELGLKRLQREIAIERATTRNGSLAGNERTCGGSTGERASVRAGAAQRSARGDGVAFWWRHVAVAACLTLAVFAGVSTQSWQDTTDSTQLAGSANGALLQVTFKPQATEAAIRALLLDTGLTIQAGPSSLGIYHLHLDGSADGATLKGALQKLRSRRDIVDTAEMD